MDINTVQDFEEALKHGPYVWPGGYPCYFVMKDGEALSFKAAEQEKETIIKAMEDQKEGYNNDQWIPIAFEVNWEDEDLVCAHTYEKIECAYPSEANE